jgi:AraC-like DNA-binding protein
LQIDRLTSLDPVNHAGFGAVGEQLSSLVPVPRVPHSFTEIALLAGFAHQSHMARHMRKILGVAPGDLRRIP